jgi:hypothetical protein
MQYELPIYTSREYLHKIADVPEIKTYSTAISKQSITHAKSHKDIISEKTYYKSK